MFAGFGLLTARQFRRWSRLGTSSRSPCIMTDDRDWRSRPLGIFRCGLGAWLVDGGVRSVGRSARLLVPDRLQGEVVFFHGPVVLDLLQRQPRTAAATQFGHFELPRRPDALDVLDG